MVVGIYHRLTHLFLFSIEIHGLFLFLGWELSFTVACGLFVGKKACAQQVHGERVPSLWA
jgi:hypothetical protein